MIRAYQGRLPQIAASAYIDAQAVIIGDVVIGEQSSVWPCTVIRGDVNFIRIGARSNVQDGSVLHVMRETHPLILGDDVTVGHGVILHGCRIPARSACPPGSMSMGHPGKLRPTLTAAENDSIDHYARNYVRYSESYKAQ